VLSGPGDSRQAAIVCPRVGQSAAGCADQVAEGRPKLLLAQREHAHAVTEHSVGRANGHLAVALRIPSQPNPWEKLSPLIAVETVAAAILFITRKDHARGGVLIDSAMDSGSEQSRVKVRILPRELLVYRCVRFPSHAVVHREARCDLPGILDVERLIELAAVEAVDSALSERGYASQHEIGQNIA